MRMKLLGCVEWQAMIEDSINDDRTVAGGGKDMILAGRYHILRQLGQGGMGVV